MAHRGAPGDELEEHRRMNSTSRGGPPRTAPAPETLWTVDRWVAPVLTKSSRRTGEGFPPRGARDTTALMALPEQVRIRSLPLPLRWIGRPEAWESSEGSVSISAGPRCDLFVDPCRSNSAELERPPMLVCEPRGDFALSARVVVDLASTYDAGVLVVFRDELCWAKLCFERSPQGQPTVVSVVNRRVSDDCNHFTVAESQIWFRIARGGDCFAFHASTDGARWQLVRYFALDDAAGISVGFMAQSPTGEGCRVGFDEISFEAGRLADLRCGA